MFPYQNLTSNLAGRFWWTAEKITNTTEALHNHKVFIPTSKEVLIVALFPRAYLKSSISKHSDGETQRK